MKAVEGESLHRRSSDSTISAHGLQEFVAFHCNFRGKRDEPCTQVLQEAWVTQCSHVFCKDHAREWFGANEDCPVCREGRVQIERKDFSKSTSKAMCFIGMNPWDIIKASENALSFWVDQKVLEQESLVHRHQSLEERHKRMEELIKVRLKEVEVTCNNLEAEQRDLTKKIEAVDNETSVLGDELRCAQRELALAEQQHKSLMDRIAGNTRGVFHRPLLSAPSPLARSSVPASLSTSFYGQQGCEGSGVGGSRVSAAAPAMRRLPTFTPGILGQSRFTKRRIT